MKDSSTVFLASSPVELLSAVTCIGTLGIVEAVVFVERSFTYAPEPFDQLLAAVRRRSPETRFVELEISRHLPEPPEARGWRWFIRGFQGARIFRERLDSACQAELGVSLEFVSRNVREIYFTFLHEWVLYFIESCRSEAARVIYPHGFDQPRRSQFALRPFEFSRRSLTTMWRTIPSQRAGYGLGRILSGAVGRLLPCSALSLPFTGVDRVLTFRTGIDYGLMKVDHVAGLEKTFRWLIQEEPWAEQLRARRSAASGDAVLLLVGEYEKHPIWEKNDHFGLAHLQLLRSVVRRSGSKRIVIKAHVRSDGSDTKWVADYLRKEEDKWEIEVLPELLHAIPVEALVLTNEFGAACSLGSCSLPPGLGFGVTHFVNTPASALFDRGWRQPHWVSRYGEIAPLLIDDGICVEVDLDIATDAQVSA